MSIMTKAAVVILAGTESHADHGRLANGLEAAKEFAETDGDELEVISMAPEHSGFRNSKTKIVTTTNSIRWSRLTPLLVITARMLSV